MEHTLPTPALVPEFAVSDWQASRSFYVNILGFSVKYERPEEGFVYLCLGTAELMLDQIGMGRTFDGGLAPQDSPFGRGVNIQLKVPAVLPILQRIEHAGLSLYLPLEEKWYRREEFELGNRQFIITDPDGYLLRCFEDLGSRPCKSGF